MKFIKIVFLVFAYSAFAQESGTISGIITEKGANGLPISSVNVALINTKLSTTTDLEGKYILTAPVGTYIIRFSLAGYKDVEEGLEITSNQAIIINKSLNTVTNNLKDVVVKSSSANREKETLLLLDQKKAVEIKQSIGAQEMARKGISDVEEGLTKITGITKVGDRGLFIRGLEDRYNNLLINDLQVPSNTPFRKIIPLEIFPTDIVGVLNVYKTMNPNISGDFAGGTINIETAIGKGKTTKLSVGYGYTTDNNGERFLISSDANTTQGFLGLIQKDRELPASFGAAPSGVKLTSSQVKEDYKNNSWNVDESASPINSSISFLHNDKVNFKNGNNLSYIISLNADNKYQVRKGVDRTFNQGQGNYDNDLFRTQFNYITYVSALLGLKYKANRYNLAYNSFYIRSTENRIQDQFGSTNGIPLNNNVLIRLNQYEQSNYFANQLLADYKLTEDGKHTIKAGGSFVKTAFQQPDRKFIVGNKINDTDIFVQNGGNHLNRQYLNVNGNYYMSGLAEYNYKFDEKENGKSNKLTIGYNTFRNDLSSTYRFLSGKPAFISSYTTNLNSIDTQISNDVANGIIKITEESNADYKAKINQFVNAGYVNLFWNLTQKLDANVGFRIENANQVIKYRDLSDSFDDNYRIKSTNLNYILPSLNIKYGLTEKSNLRFAASTTVTRPVTMELLPIEYVNADGTVVAGNKDLQDSENINVDLKYELFPNAKEMIVVGLFGKTLKNPIERILYPTASSGGQITTFQNSKGATIFGTELEFLLQLSRINKSLSNFSIGINASLMKTDVSINLVTNPIENSASRKLQGASEWLFNSDLKYDFQFNEVMKNSISVVYNVYGDRIFAVGTAGTDHLFEKSFHKLDMIWSSKISKNIDLKFSVENILNPSYKFETGSNSTITIYEKSLIMREYKRGVGYSLNFSYSF